MKRAGLGLGALAAGALLLWQSLAEPLTYQ